MSSVKTAPRFSTQEAQKIALDLYQIKAEVKPLSSERDQNCLLTVEDRPAYVLKIANSSEKKEILDFENQAMCHIASKDTIMRCPRVIESVSGKLIEAIKSSDDKTHFVRLITYLPGVPLGEVQYHSPELLEYLGRFTGELTQAFEGFSHPAMNRELIWDFKQAEKIIGEYRPHIVDSGGRKLIDRFFNDFKAYVIPELKKLRMGVVHNDSNDFNLLVETLPSMEKRISGIVDFGDMVYGYKVGELAVAAAYAMMNKNNPFQSASQIVRGFNEVFPLKENEIKVLFSLICIRLCLSVCISAYQKKLQPKNEYLTISEQPAWKLLKQLSDIHPNFAHYTLRHACGLMPCPQTQPITDWIKQHQSQFVSVIGKDLNAEKKVVFDLSVGSLDFDQPPEAMNLKQMADLLFGKMEKAGARIGIGRYDEPRLVYTSDLFSIGDTSDIENRTVHLGIDIFMEAGSQIYAPLDGKVHSFQNNANPLDYGPTIILEHEEDNGRIRFFTLYGHLGLKSLDNLEKDKSIQKGDLIGWIGEELVNGGWIPHLHFQIMTDMIGKEGDFPGVVAPSERDIWLSLIPDANLVLGIPKDIFPDLPIEPEEILRIRQNHLSRSMSVSYKKPLKIVRGYMQYLYDEEGRKYLDAVNNVPHVGHSHPKVVEAVRKQIGVLNTNTRYLHDNLVRYSQRLVEIMPDPLSVCFIVGSGSEANDLAIRLAKARTGDSDMIVVDGAYHGNLSTLIDLSPYKFDGSGGLGKPEHVQMVPMPDTYRGEFKSNDTKAGEKYALYVKEACGRISKNGKGVAAFFCESLLGCGGQIVLPDGYLKAAYSHVREAGGICVADEVQVGFGRVGTHMWGFQTQDVIPDIVALGKPIGNGFPLAAVVTTPEIAHTFDAGMEYFNTYGGNPVSCAVGLIVLDVIRDEKLQENALQVGAYFIKSLQNLQKVHPLIGDVRGLGLFVGVELVRDHETLEPADAEASYIVERMKENGVLISTDGPLHNVLKIKPPIVFSKNNVEFFVQTLDRILTEEF